MNESSPSRAGTSTPVLIQFGRYTIERLLGIGGMAEIYRARVSGLEGFEKPVVIKRVRSQYAQDETIVRMFVDEAKICASLNHANLVSVYDFGSEAGHYYMAMEFIDGLDLRTAHVRHAQHYGRPLPWDVSTLIVRDVLRGLDYAHKLTDGAGRPMGIVHRDIDLANVMVRRDGAVKVLDFGCAKAAGFVRRTETVAGVIKGKLGYMSPEQAEDRPLDARSDLWAAGVVLHELLSGRRLFYGEDPLGVIRSVLSRPIPDPRSMNPQVPEALSAIVLRALRRDRDQRFSDAAAMANALEGLILEHRIPSSRITEVLGALMDVPGDQDSPDVGLTQDQRRLTLATWAESTADAEPLEVISGVLVDEGGTDVHSAPFIDATIITTNPRWHIPRETPQAGSVGSGESPGLASPVLHDRRTEILMVHAPPAGLHEEETVLLTEADRKPGVGLGAFQERTNGTEPVLHEEPVESGEQVRSGGPRGALLPLLLLGAGVSVVAMVLLVRYCL